MMQGRLKSLKTEMASAVLAAGLLLGNSAVAQTQEESVFSVENDTTQLQVNNTIDLYNPQIPENVIFSLALLAILGSGYFACRNISGTTRRAVALAAGFTALANPQNVFEQYRVLPTIIPVFVDTSDSIGARAPLVETAFRELEGRLALLGPVTIQRVDFGSDDVSNSRQGTHLLRTMSTTMANIPADQVGATFVITDGVIQDSRALMQIANLSNPTHVMIAGHEEEQDFFVRIESLPSLGIKGDYPDITFRVTNAREPDHEGSFEATVRIGLGGQESILLTVPVNQSYTISLEQLSSSGLALGNNVLSIEIVDIQGEQVARLDRNGDGQPDEVTYRNNRITTTIEGIGQEMNVLYIHGAPYQGTRLWRDMFLLDPNVSLTQIGYSRPLEKEDATPLRDLATIAVPLNELLVDNIDEFDIIVLDNVRYNGDVPLHYFARIGEYAERGGGLIIAGADNLTAPNSLSRTPLSPFLPLSPLDFTLEQRFTPQVTEDGTRHPVGRAILGAGNFGSWGSWYRIAPAQISIPSQVILSDEQNNPLLALSRVGEGRVAMLTSDQAFLWQRGHDGGGPAQVLYQTMTGWVMGNPRYDEEGLRISHENGQVTVRLQTMEEEVLPVIITLPDGQDIELALEEQSPGLYVATIPAEQNGGYSVRYGSQDTAIDFTSVGFTDPSEMYDVISTPAHLAPLAEFAEGKISFVGDIDYALNMPRIVTSDAQPDHPDAYHVNMSTKKELIGTERKPIIPPWLLAMLSMGMLAYSFKPREATHSEWLNSMKCNWLNKSPPDTTGGPS
jgi:hypothetical protein